MVMYCFFVFNVNDNKRILNNRVLCCLGCYSNPTWKLVKIIYNAYVDDVDECIIAHYFTKRQKLQE